MIPKIGMGKEISVNRDTAYELSGIVTGIRVVADRIDVTRFLSSKTREYLPEDTRTFITVAPWNVEVQIYDTDEVDVEP